MKKQIAFAALFSLISSGCFPGGMCGEADPLVENGATLSLSLIVDRPDITMQVYSDRVFNGPVITEENPYLGDTVRLFLYGEERYRRTHVNSFVTVDSQVVRIEFHESDSVVVE